MAPAQDGAPPRSGGRLGSLAGGGSGSGGGGGRDVKPEVKEELTHGGVKKTRFVPKVPTRRAPKKTVKQEADAEDTKLDASLQALLKQSQENPSGAFGRRIGFRDSKSGGPVPLQVAFGFGSGAVGRVGAPSGLKSSVSGGGGGGGRGGGGGGDDGEGGGGGGRAGVDRKGVETLSRSTFEVDDERFPDVKPRKKEWRDPLDYSRNYPTTLPLRLPQSGPTELLNEAEFGEAAQKAAFNEDAVKPAEGLGLKEKLDEERLLFFQLPSSLPLGDIPLAEREGEGEAASAGIGRLKLSDLPGGLMGKLKIHASGAVKLHLGSVVLEALPGAKCMFHQELAAVNAEAGTCLFLGDVTQRVVLTPDMDNLLMEGGR